MHPSALTGRFDPPRRLNKLHSATPLKKYDARSCKRWLDSVGSRLPATAAAACNRSQAKRQKIGTSIPTPNLRHHFNVHTPLVPCINASRPFGNRLTMFFKYTSSVACCKSTSSVEKARHTVCAFDHPSPAIEDGVLELLAIAWMRR